MRSLLEQFEECQSGYQHQKERAERHAAARKALEEQLEAMREALEYALRPDALVYPGSVATAAKLQATLADVSSPASELVESRDHFQDFGPSAVSDESSPAMRQESA